MFHRCVRVACLTELKANAEALTAAAVQHKNAGNNAKAVEVFHKMKAVRAEFHNEVARCMKVCARLFEHQS